MNLVIHFCSNSKNCLHSSSPKLVSNSKIIIACCLFVVYCPFEIHCESESDSEYDTDSDDLDVCIDPDYKFNKPKNESSEPYSREKIREIVEFWKSSKKRKTIDQLKHRYRKVKSIRNVERWDMQIQQGKQV